MSHPNHMLHPNHSVEREGRGQLVFSWRRAITSCSRACQTACGVQGRPGPPTWLPPHRASSSVCTTRAGPLGFAPPSSPSLHASLGDLFLTVRSSLTAVTFWLLRPPDSAQASLVAAALASWHLPRPPAAPARSTARSPV